ncbi:MAG TPA: DUF4185 domain-containing protein [Thermoanaerobaculia bacterium]|nr:DUF4185 domain-containing protein [Thermoanaerobaculia bacterium]
MTRKQMAAAVALSTALGLPHLRAAEPGAPVAVVRIGRSEKICQLTGDTDWETGRPTAARTFANAGLDAADLGYPVEHGGKLILLFGDSWPPPHGGGAAGEIPADDAVGVSLRSAPPTGADGRCLELEVHHDMLPAGHARAGARQPQAAHPPRFAPATIVGPALVKQGFFNVPAGGVSAGGALFAFFWTDHCSDPNRLKPSPGDPLARPSTDPAHDCPETDHRNSLGRGVLARSDDLGRTFSQVVAMPTGFVYATAVNAEPLRELPAAQRLGVFIFASPRYRASAPYLAYAPAQSFADPGSWRFFTGRAADGQPKWVSRDAWAGPSGPPNAARTAPWNAPGEPELLAAGPPGERSVGELSVTWNRPLGMWLMLHGSARGIVARVARAPWGPWSEPSTILSGDDGLGCRLVMTENGCGGRRDFWPGKRKNGKFVGGGLYAPYVLNRYTTAAAGDGASRGATIYWLISTWNPYEVTVMRTTLRSASPSPRQAVEP